MSREDMKLDALIEEITELKGIIGMQTSEIKKIATALIQVEVNQEENAYQSMQAQIELIRYEITEINRCIGLLNEDNSKFKRSNKFKLF